MLKLWWPCTSLCAATKSESMLCVCSCSTLVLTIR